MRRLGGALKRAATVGVVLALTLGMATPATMSFADDAAGDAGQSSTLEQNQKMATELDENLETKVTLSFPGKREAEPSDVVFVLDKSGASAQKDIYNQAKQFLGQISQKAKDDGLDIKVGVVLFNKKGNIQQQLTDVVTGYDDILAAMNSSVRSGTNMDAGLLAAKSILDADTAVKAENKHVILISDGATYLYCKNGDYATPYTRSFGKVEGGKNFMGGIWEWQSREYHTNNAWKQFSDGSNFIFSQAMKSPEKLGEYLAYYRDQYQNSDKNWAQYDYEYTAEAADAGTTNPIPIDVTAPCNIDVAFWSTDDTFQSMVNAGYDMNVYYKNAADFDGQVFLQYLTRNSNNGQLDTDFADIKAKLVDKIAAGSTVEDFIGADFDFVNDPAKISLTANGEKLAPEKIDDGAYGFGKLANGSYRFTLDYVNGDQEVLKLTLNEAASPSKPVVLEYSERLVNVPTEPGTHTLKVNESAILQPIDGNGMRGDAYEFPVPTVTYTVAAPEPKPEPEVKPTKPSDKKPVKTTKGEKGTMPMTGDTFSILPVIGLVVAGAAVCVAGIILKRRNH
ncbi:VWA domain-containing protein [Collinsella aerofaciens]|uniref:vWA domain-containing protein n=1 Tax=Collinsella aerofaciens TaxID=74426 RepID=UPI001BB11C72|nr:vWA domain-containing protein [Collinsella aerofaciens]MDB1875642.1 VWA domain-containing protein [Collinsella aerofaciens]MDB1877549.1 VWA domain-containing protein [Collinsella aerofaciens]